MVHYSRLPIQSVPSTTAIVIWNKLKSAGFLRDRAVDGFAFSLTLYPMFHV